MADFLKDNSVLYRVNVQKGIGNNKVNIPIWHKRAIAQKQPDTLAQARENDLEKKYQNSIKKNNPKLCGIVRYKA